MQVVLSISALDKFIHDIIRIGMIECFNGLRKKTKAYKNFTVDLQFIEDSYNNFYPFEYLLDQKIIQKHKSISFQHPDNIKAGLSLIWDEEHKWAKIANNMNIDERNLKHTLKNLVLRRNQIVHEGDFNVISNTMQDIQENEVRDIVNFIDDIGNSIYKLVNRTI
jgi:hypothetical protein